MADDAKRAQGGRTLLTSLVLSAPGPLVTGIAAVLSGSATQVADFIRRTAELAATVVSFVVFRRTQRGAGASPAERARLEALAARAVSWAMVLAGIAMGVVGAVRLFVPKESGSVVMGLVIALLGVLTNTWFWLRYRRIALRGENPVMAAQQRLYRAKALVDYCVAAALLVVALWPGYPVTRYVDAVGSIVVAVYLVANGLRGQAGNA